MAEPRKYNSKLNAKGLEASVSEDQARHMADHQGHTYLFLVKAHSGPKTVAEDGSEKVNLIVDVAELVPERFEAPVQDALTALYAARPEQHGQQPFEDTAGAPDAEEAVAGLSVVGTWDGNPDAPTSEAGTDDGGDPDVGQCLYPGCYLPEDHEGAHQKADDDADGV